MREKSRVRKCRICAGVVYCSQNLRHAKVMPGRLTKKIEVERDGSMIQEHVRRFREFKCREFNIIWGILEKFGLSDNCKGCAAAASGTDAKRHTND